MPFDKSKFIERFKAETREHMERLSLGLLKLEKSPADTELLNTLMREAHTIKGSATMMGYKRIADIGHRMEDGLEKALKGELILEKPHFDMLLKCLDAIGPLLDDKVTWEDKGIGRPFVEELCEEAEAVFSGKAAKAVKKEIAAPAEEKPKQPAAAVSAQIPAVTGEGSVRVDIDKLDRLMNLSGELSISKIRLNELVKNLNYKLESHAELGEACGDLIKDLGKVDDTINLLTSGIQGEVMDVRMIPVAALFNTFPRAMRDLAYEKGKEVDFEIKGQDTELDKAIIDELKDPLLHLLRNAIGLPLFSGQLVKIVKSVFQIQKGSNIRASNAPFWCCNTFPRIQRFFF